MAIAAAELSSKVKNDQKDSLKIAKFALDHWVDFARIYTYGHRKTTTENL